MPVTSTPGARDRSDDNVTYFSMERLPKGCPSLAEYKNQYQDPFYFIVYINDRNNAYKSFLKT